MPFSSYLFNSLSSHQPKTFPPPSMISHHSKSSTTTTTTNFFERIEEQKHRPDFMTKSFPRCFTLKLPSMLAVDQEEVKVSKTSSTVVAVEARANLQVGFSRSFLATLPALRNVNVNQNPHRHLFGLCFWASK